MATTLFDIEYGTYAHEEPGTEFSIFIIQGPLDLDGSGRGVNLAERDFTFEFETFECIVRRSASYFDTRECLLGQTN